jgi:hypothetical protein
LRGLAAADTKTKIEISRTVPAAQTKTAKAEKAASPASMLSSGENADGKGRQNNNLRF